MHKQQPGQGKGVAVPAFTGRWPNDKAPEDATTVEEVA
jgi:hypothetical protein